MLDQPEHLSGIPICSPFLCVLFCFSIIVAKYIFTPTTAPLPFIPFALTIHDTDARILLDAVGFITHSDLVLITLGPGKFVLLPV